MGAVCLLETDLPVQNRNDRRETRTIAAERWVNETWRQPFHRYYWVESKCLHTVVPRWFVALDLRPILSVACIVCLLEKRSFSCFIHAENVRMLWRRAKQFFSVVLFLLFHLPALQPNRHSVFIPCHEEEEVDSAAAAMVAWAVQCSSYRLIYSKISDRIHCSMCRRRCSPYVRALQALRNSFNNH